MISYRSFEVSFCVGLQLLMELCSGLCDNHKPNRFFGIERKRSKESYDSSCKALFLLIGDKLCVIVTFYMM